jgi:hypothetical protein
MWGMRHPFNEEVAHRSRPGKGYANLSAMIDEKQLSVGLKLNSNQSLMCEEISLDTAVVESRIGTA